MQKKYKDCGEFLLNKEFVKSVLGGICISIGCIINMSCDNRYIGAVLFAFGLLTICQFEYNLFTGKVCYLDDYKILLEILFFNIVGTAIVALITSISYPVKYNEVICTICTNKLNQSLLSVFFLSILCNIMIYFAVDGFKRGNTVILIFAIAIFILCGFEHCVANAFYIIFNACKEDHLSIRAIEFLTVNIIGNFIGGKIMKNVGKVVII